jgi:hypothetical protein
VKTFAALACGVLLLAASAHAGPFEDGVADYERQDYASALRHWLPLAEHGNVQAQVRVAKAYDRGLGVAADASLAARWYQSAAQQGDPEAQLALGAAYETGRGLGADPDQAWTWYSAALANPNAANAPDVRRRADQGLARLVRAGEEVIGYDGGRYVISRPREGSCVVALQGTITRSAASKFDDALARSAARGCPSPWLLLESPGGVIPDGIWMGKEVRSRKLRTLTRSDCASICAIIFLGGVERELVASRARIGLHQASTLRAGSARHCSANLDDNGTRELRSYLRWTIPDSADVVMKLIMDTPCNSIDWVQGQRAVELGLATRVETRDANPAGERR